MNKKAAFISFDYENDELTKMGLVNQANLNDSPFSIIDRSVKEHLTGDWKEKVRGRIKRADLVIFLCGEKTNTATGVAVELEITQELRKPHFFLKAHSDRICRLPSTATVVDRFYNFHDWTWPNLKALIHGK